MPNKSTAPPEQLQTTDLVLRRYRPEDALALHESITTSIDHLRPWMAWISFEPQTVAQRVALISQWNTKWHEGSEYTMGVFLDEVFVGSTGLHFRGDFDVVEIGYWIDIRFVRRGFAKQIVEVLTNLVFDLWLHIDRVEIHVDINNDSSSTVAHHSGFELEDTSEREPQAPAEQGLLLHWVKRRNGKS